MNARHITERISDLGRVLDPRGGLIVMGTRSGVCMAEWRGAGGRTVAGVGHGAEGAMRALLNRMQAAVNDDAERTGYARVLELSLKRS